MELVEAGKLHLDDTVFGPGAILGTTYGTKPYAANVKQITIRHLASHTSGWSNDGGDPMFMNKGFNQAQVIGWMLDNRPLKNGPGKAFEYLNFGFCVLGRVIEKVTGIGYEDYVKQAVLSKCGITRMQIGAEAQANKAPHEVTYYGSSPYNLLTHRMDAHGGWIATPIDLLRMMVRVDGFTSKADILSPVDETSMDTGSTANPSYALGPGPQRRHGRHDGLPGPARRRDLLRRPGEHPRGRRQLRLGPQRRDRRLRRQRRLARLRPLLTFTGSALRKTPPIPGGVLLLRLFPS
jgi:CubicO group peptidase (beta-lactamase class C family)